MKIAIVGAGIAGLTAAYYLNKQHQVTVFESADRVGGHTATVDVNNAGTQYAIDTGFIVYNDWTYPKFIELLNELKVSTKSTSMSFSVSCSQTNLEYAGSNLNTLFAQRKNLLNPRFLTMLRDIVRFNKEAIEDLEQQRINEDITLGQYLVERNYGNLFIDKFLVPMGAAIWSSGTESMLDFPMLFFVRFFKNHGLLSIKNRPQWRVIEGGSRSYIDPLVKGFKNTIYTGVKIKNIQRSQSEVKLSYVSTAQDSVKEETFDALVIATHSDQALELLTDPDQLERNILSAMPYQSNQVVLHTDQSLLPKSRRAWSSWNYRLQSNQSDKQLAKLTYNMNILQGIRADTTFCVSLNQTESINPDKIIQSFEYSHPVFTLEGMAAQRRWQEIAGINRTWYCGAYWKNGFHEDGVMSGLRVVDSINAFSVSNNIPFAAVC